MTNTPAQAVNVANSITKGYGGLCLKFVRTCYNIGNLYGSARSAWENATIKHPGADLSRCPVGAPIFLDHARSKYGHVALYMGNGKMRTTNSATNRVSTVPIATWVGWGYYVLGWTQDLNGVKISGLDPRPAPTPAPSATSDYNPLGVSVIEFQRWLRKTFPGYKKSVTVRRGELIDVDNKPGPQTRAWTRELQRRTGIAQTGILDATTLATARAYGFKH